MNKKKIPVNLDLNTWKKKPFECVGLQICTDDLSAW